MTPPSKPRIPRSIQTLFGVALLFLLLGVGNVLYGGKRVREFQKLLFEANAELASPVSKHVGRHNTVPLLGSLNIDNETKHIARLRAQVDFYTLVILGGRVFLAVAGILTLAGVVLLRRQEESPPAPPK